ncbi:MAG: hypothetical protein KDD47_20455, partial [Acidobacteria bacterium]|nr:hypothetical protein [Acidobacteriota bacterium]
MESGRERLGWNAARHGAHRVAAEKPFILSGLRPLLPTAAHGMGGHDSTSIGCRTVVGFDALGRGSLRQVRPSARNGRQRAEENGGGDAQGG